MKSHHLNHKKFESATTWCLIPFRTKQGKRTSWRWLLSWRGWSLVVRVELFLSEVQEMGEGTCTLWMGRWVCLFTLYWIQWFDAYRKKFLQWNIRRMHRLVNTLLFVYCAITLIISCVLYIWRFIEKVLFQWNIRRMHKTGTVYCNDMRKNW